MSVVLATLAGWNSARSVIDMLARQADEVSGEVVIADGSGDPRPGGRECPARVAWLSLPGAGIFDLRLAALRRALGDVVVVTEDHCLVPSDWCRRIVDLHARHPEADVIQGQICNASRTTWIDWAAFLATQASHVPPIEHAAATRQVGIGGVSLKRRALDALLAAHPDIPPELIPTSDLSAHRLHVRIEDTLTIAHVQSETWLGHGALHFHNARAIAGIRRGRMRPRDWLRLVAAPALAPYRAGRVMARSLRKDVPRRAVLGAAPALAWLYVCKGVGECTGYLAGPGDSARRLR